MEYIFNGKIDEDGTVCKLHTVTVVLDCKDRNAKCFKVLAGCKG